MPRTTRSISVAGKCIQTQRIWAIAAMLIGELGIALKPMTNHGFYFDLGVQAYTGKRDGVTAGLFIGRSF